MRPALRAVAAAAALAVAACMTLEDGKIYYADDVPPLKLGVRPAKAGTLDCRCGGRGGEKG